MNDRTTPPGNHDPVPDVTRSYGITAERLLTYIELDLWSRFRGRLWAVVGVVLTIYALVGMLGVSAYIRARVDSRIEAESVRFSEDVADALASARMLALVAVQHQVALQKLRVSIYELSDDINAYQAGRNDVAWLSTLRRELLAVVAREQFDEAYSPLLRFSLTRADTSRIRISDRRADSRRNTWLPSRYLLGASGEPRDLRDGTLRGHVRDIRFQMIAVEAHRRALDAYMVAFSRGNGTDERTRSRTAAAVRFAYLDAFLPVLEREQQTVYAQLAIDADSSFSNEFRAYQLADSTLVR